MSRRKPSRRTMTRRPTESRARRKYVTTCASWIGKSRSTALSSTRMVEPVTTFDKRAFIRYRDRPLVLERDATFRELSAQAGLVSRLPTFRPSCSISGHPAAAEVAGANRTALGPTGAPSVAALRQPPPCSGPEARSTRTSSRSSRGASSRSRDSPDSAWSASCATDRSSSSTGSSLPSRGR